MWTVLLTVLVSVLVAGLIIQFAPAGWRTRIVMWVHGSAIFLSGIVEQLQIVDWTKLIDAPKVAYGLALSIPIIGSWLREITKSDPGKPPAPPPSEG